VYLYDIVVQLLAGNSNTYFAELRELRPVVIARRVRFVPYSSHPRTVCMRVELYGCSWTGQCSVEPRNLTTSVNRLTTKSVNLTDEVCNFGRQREPRVT